MGLGLTISNGIVRAHGGRMWVEERPGGGASFRFTLPLEKAAARPMEPATVAAGAMTEAKPTVLLVEDEPQMRTFVRIALTANGYRVIEAETGTLGVQQAAAHTPDVVLLDLGLPDIDGVEVTRRVREWSAVPILVISARGQESKKVEALDAGADDYVTKPFGAGELLARLRVALRHAARSAQDPLTSVMTAGNLRVDFAKRLVFLGEDPRSTSRRSSTSCSVSSFATPGR